MKTDITNAPVAPTSRFVLTRKNQKGQVAIFVALIFQVIFVFFALLINVGLLVHHKINLQQSTDLAAYYGAMKQAEVMNAMAHVNFQIKQNWKLMTWRYRILGTFGFQKATPGAGPGIAQEFPFEFKSNTFDYNGRAETTACNVGGPEQLGVQDIPFFCVGHSGFNGWPSTENLCRLDCAQFSSARIINQIPLVADAGYIPEAGNTTADVNQALSRVQTNREQLCNSLAEKGGAQLARFASAYINENVVRTKTMEMLAKNLTLPPDQARDIEGKRIIDGSFRTLKNNLTEANMSSFSEDNMQAANGLNENRDCGFTNGKGNSPEFLKKIEFNFINYFMQNCSYPAGDFRYEAEAVFDNTGDLGSGFRDVPLSLQNIMRSLRNPNYYHTVGYEKNPHCVQYYGVRASTEPNIPFLPLKKIKLHAVAFAKPFGGSIGPWYGKAWPQASNTSVATETDNSSKMDETLPVKTVSPGAGLGSLTASLYSQPNFSLFVGDRLGLRNPEYIAAYHSMLAMRDIENYGSKNYTTNRNPGNVFTNPGRWPAYGVSAPPSDNWAEISDAEMTDFRQYDALASDDADKGMRAVELTAIAPNQFDIVHYSIDPDFYNNYYRKLYRGFDDLAGATGMSGFNKNQLRADFGAVNMDADNDTQPPPFDVRSFSVKDQILVKNTVLRSSPNPGPGKTYAEILSALVSLQSSLLSSWTFLNFSDFNTFPGDEVNNTDRTMSFGQCFDEWNKTSSANTDRTDSDNFLTPMDINRENPPAAGNCVTGGRTGYSVKLVSPVMLRDPGKLKNPVSENFFNF